MDLHVVNQGPVVIADSFFSDQEYKLMFDEFKSIKQRGFLMSGNETCGAVNTEDGSLKKQNSSAFVDEIYPDKMLSDILTINRKVFFPATVSELIKIHPFFNYMLLCSNDNTLLSYYDNGNKYEEHRDSSVISVLTWFYDEPKRFGGGDLIVEKELKVECKANRTVFMPSYMLHAVTPVKPQKADIGMGRYSMTQFFYI